MVKIYCFLYYIEFKEFIFYLKYFLSYLFIMVLITSLHLCRSVVFSCFETASWRKERIYRLKNSLSLRTCRFGLIKYYFI